MNYNQNPIDGSAMEGSPATYSKCKQFRSPSVLLDFHPAPESIVALIVASEVTAGFVNENFNNALASDRKVR